MDVRQEMLAALCLMENGDQGRSLLQFLPPEEEEALARFGNRFMRSEGQIDGRQIARRIRELARLETWSGLEEIHPDWILEALADESPLVLGIVLRFLSGEKARRLLARLPATIRVRLPGLRESFEVAGEIVDLVRALLERRLGLRLPPRGASFSFAHVAWMKGEDLRVLFRELGLGEIRRAFSGAERSRFRAFLSRFSPSQAREIRERIDGAGAVSKAAREQAQMHLVAISLPTLPPEELFREIGFSVFARAIEKGEEELVRLVCRRLCPEEGYRLLRLFKETERCPAEANGRKEEILRSVWSLGGRGKIGRYWHEEGEVEVTNAGTGGRAA